MALALLAGVTSADVVHLKSGGRLEGKVLSNDGGTVVLETLTGRVTVTAGQIKSVDTAHTSTLEIYYQKYDAIKGKTNARSFLELAIWARDHKARRFVRGLAARAAELLQAKEDLEELIPIASAAAARLGKELNPFWERVIAVDSTHEKARRMLGFRRHGDQWLTEEEFQVVQGNVRFEGHWISKEARTLILKERELRLKERLAEVRRREKKVEDAEARLDRIQRMLEQMKRDLDRAAAAVAERERKVKEREDRLRQYTYCRACNAYYSGVSHICGKKWGYCKKCAGYFPHGHVHK